MNKKQQPNHTTKGKIIIIKVIRIDKINLQLPNSLNNQRIQN